MVNYGIAIINYKHINFHIFCPFGRLQQQKEQFYLFYNTDMMKSDNAQYHWSMLIQGIPLYFNISVLKMALFQNLFFCR